MSKPIPTFSADELTAIAVDVQESCLVIAANQGDAIRFAKGQFSQLVEQAIRASDGDA